MDKKYGAYVCTGCGIGDTLDTEALCEVASSEMNMACKTAVVELGAAAKRKTCVCNPAPVASHSEPNPKLASHKHTTNPSTTSNPCSLNCAGICAQGRTGCTGGKKAKAVRRE